MLEFVTFLLAPIAYAGLTLAAIKAARDVVPVWLVRAVAAVTVSHVILIWVVRYEGQWSEATRNGYIGFVLFHSALLAIVAAAFASQRVARALILGAFGVVTFGAVGAVFRYDVVALYRVPVLLCAIGGMAGLVWAHRAERRRGARAASPAGDADAGRVVSFRRESP